MDGSAFAANCDKLGEGGERGRRFGAPLSFAGLLRWAEF
jgi:hypothetical protein